MSILKRQEERIVRFWKSLSANRQISTLIFIATFIIFMKYGNSFYESIELRYVMDVNEANAIEFLFDLIIIVIIAWILYIIIFQIGQFLDVLSSKKIAIGLNYAFVSFFGFFGFSLLFVTLFQGGALGITLKLPLLILLGIFFSLGVSYTWYGSINLIKSLMMWLTTDDKNMKVEQKNTLVLTFIGVIISLIALFG